MESSFSNVVENSGNVFSSDMRGPVRSRSRDKGRGLMPIKFVCNNDYKYTSSSSNLRTPMELSSTVNTSHNIGTIAGGSTYLTRRNIGQILFYSGVR